MAALEKGVLGNGTHVWVLHGEVPTLTRILCIKSIDTGDDTPTEVDDNCLDNDDAKTSDWGVDTIGDGSILINTDPKNATHMLLLQLAADRETIGVYIGWSDGTSVPTVVADVVTLPQDRSWSYFTSKIRKGKPVFEPDALVNHTLPLKRRTAVIDEFKVAP